MGYFKRFRHRAWKDFKESVGEQVVGALLVIGILYFQYRYGLIRPSDLRANAWSVAWPYIALVVAFVIWHLVKTPYKLDQDRENEEDRLRYGLVEQNQQRQHAEQKLHDERPRIAFTVRSPKTIEEWHSLESVHPPSIFRLEHYAGRAARFVKIDPVMSSLGTFRMEFDEAPILEGSHRQLHTLTFTVHQNNAPDLSYDPRILKVQQGVSMLQSFFRDHSPQEKEGSYKVTIRYRDHDGIAEHEANAILKCEYARLILSVHPD